MKKIFKLFGITFALIGFLNAMPPQPTFKVKTVTGKELTFKGLAQGIETSPYEGKVVFIEFWGTWCGPCLMSIPHEVELQEKYKDSLKIVAIETTPSVSNGDLKKFVQDGGKAIDMSKLEWFLQHKATTPQAKAFFEKPVAQLKDFIKSGKKINYDLISSKDGKELIDYIAKRAGWQGSIPFLIVLKPDGTVSNILQGIVSQDQLQRAFNNAIKKKPYKAPVSN